MNITKVIHYGDGDVNCGMDYWSIDLVVEDKIIAHFGDAYHEQGEEMAVGFVLGVEWATGKKVKLTTKHVADGVE